MHSDRARTAPAGWYEASNGRDLDEITSHWAEDALFTSPLVARLTGDASGTVEGRRARRDYRRKGLDADPGPHVEPRGPDGRVVRGWAHYGPATA